MTIRLVFQNPITYYIATLLRVLFYLYCDICNDVAIQSCLYLLKYILALTIVKTLIIKGRYKDMLCT